MLEPQSYTVAESPLFGNKFSTGEPSYSTFDFWQNAGNTDWQRGHGQKFVVDPAKFEDSYGLEVQDVPGEISLARAPEDLVWALGAKATCYYVDEYSGSKYLWIGTEDGKIWVANLPLTIAPTLVKDTGTAKEITQIFRWGILGHVIALVDGDHAWAGTTTGGASWSETDVDSWNHAAVWGSTCWGSFKTAGSQLYLDVKFCTNPLTQAGWTAGTTAFSLPSKDVTINNLFFAHERLYIGTHARLMATQGGDPYVLYDFSYAVDTRNFKEMCLADNYVWFAIHQVGIFYTNGATIQATSIAIDNNDFMLIHRAFAVGQNGPTVWATYFSKDSYGSGTGALNKMTDSTKAWSTNEWAGYYVCDDTETYFKIISNTATVLTVSGTPSSGDYAVGKYWLAKSKYRNYFFRYCELDTDCILPSYMTDLYIVYEDGDASKINKTCSYQTTGRLYSSRFDANLVNLDKLIWQLGVYHEPLNTGEAVKAAANFDEAYTIYQFSSWESATHSYSVTDTAPGFEVIFEGAQETGKMSYQGGKIAQRFQYGLELTSNGTSTPKIQDTYWKYYLETPAEEDAVKWQWQFALPVNNEVEKLDEETRDTYLLSARTAHEIVTNLETTRKKKQVLNFVTPNHVLTPALKIYYHGASRTAKLTIDQVNHRLGITTTISGHDVNIDLTSASYDTLGELVSYLNGLSTYICTIATGADSKTSTSLLLPVYEVDIVPDTGSSTGKLFYSVDAVYNVVIVSYRRRDNFLSALNDNESAIVYLTLREV